jgi:hypothetical protein
LDTNVSEFEVLVAEDWESGALGLELTLESVGMSRPDSVIEVELDKGNFTPRTVVSVLGNTLTLDEGFISPVSKGNRTKQTVYPVQLGFMGVDDLQEWEIGMTMEITRADGTLQLFTVHTIDRNGKWVNWNPEQIGSPINAGGIIKRKIGPDVTMVAFGTFPTSNPTPGDPEWGFRGTIDHDHAELALGMRIRAEITYEDGSVNIRRKVIGTVINR